ncbi:MAG TPA: acyltransferase [Acidobacteriaceae bacterium]|nr:acyltransferase [Acidobacteriaceae bacterium]
MLKLIKRAVRHIALRYGRLAGLYRRICNPSNVEYTEFLRRHGGFYSIGENCQILAETNFTDPAYVRIGNNVHFSSCTIVGHDGSTAMLDRAFGLKLDSVGKVDIRDNVFIGYQAIVLPNVTIGPNAIVGAGSIVTKDVLPGEIVAGNPARPIGKVEDLARKLQEQTDALPWAKLIRERTPELYYVSEPELVRQRVAYFYGGD